MSGTGAVPSLHDEREAKYEADDTFELPRLTDLLPSDGQAATLGDAPPEVQELEATYFDTADLRLARSSLTLRRRTGGSDAGWHLKVPRAGGSGPGTVRTEVRVPLGRAVGTVPASLRRLVAARTGGERLSPVAKVTNRRTVHRLVDGAGQVLLELADDRVEAWRLEASSTARGRRPAGPATSWREVEVEVVDGDAGLLEAVDARLLALGLHRARSSSKLARVLGEDAAGPASARRQPSSDATAGDVLLAYLAEQVEEVLARDVHARLDNPDSVHKMRVATRRLRSALQTFAPPVDADAARPLREELRWLAGELGAVRDAEVLRARLRDALAADELRTEEAAAEVDAALDAAHRAARERLLEALDSDRYARLLTALDELVADPPFTGRAERKAAKVLPDRVARTYRKLARAVAAADAAADDAEREHLLHEARKAAKRARYAAEAMTPAFGEDAARLAAAMEDVQEELGEHQDSVVLRERLDELVRSGAAPGTAYALGRLHTREQERGRRAQERFTAVWERSSKKKLRRWLR